MSSNEAERLAGAFNIVALPCNSHQIETGQESSEQEAKLCLLTVRR